MEPTCEGLGKVALLLATSAKICRSLCLLRWFLGISCASSLCHEREQLGHHGLGRILQKTIPPLRSVPVGRAAHFDLLHFFEMGVNLSYDQAIRGVTSIAEHSTDRKDISWLQNIAVEAILVWNLQEFHQRMKIASSA
jgi:hypothetical protein